VLFIMVLGVIYVNSIDTNELDEICSQDGSSLVRRMGIWDCGVASSGSVVSGNTTYIYNNFTNNITYNITTINNITSTLSILEPNSSYQCSNINQRLYNVTKINGLLSGLCGTDEGITTEQDTLALSAAIVQNTSTWLAINARTQYPGISNFTLAQFQTQNTTIWTAINARTEYPGISNFTLANFQAQNTTIWAAIQATGISNFTLGQYQVQNTSLWTAINSKALPFANSSTQCSGTDKLTNITSLNGLITGICSADQTGGGGATNYAILIDQTRNITGTTSSSVCAGTDKVKNVSIYNGVIATTCETDQTGGGSPASYSLLSSIENITDLDSQKRGYTCYYSEHFTTSTGDNFMLGANNSGTITQGTGNQNHPGVIRTTSSATATATGSGYGLRTETAMILLNGSETAQFIFNPVATLQVNITQYIFGFIDNGATFSRNIVDGLFVHCYKNATAGPNSNWCRAVARSNSAETNNTITTSLNQSTWYHLNITTRQESGKITANFTIYNESGFVFWNVNISSGIPSVTGRETGFGITSWKTTAGGASIGILDLDYTELCFKRRLIR
jgi:hypothetical protein